MTAGWSRNRLKFALAGPLFEAGNRFIPGRPHDRLAQLVADQHPRRVLELCGGTGYAARLLADKSPATRVDSLDISPEMLAVGCRRLTRAGIGTVVLHHGDAAAFRPTTVLEMRWANKHFPLSDYRFTRNTVQSPEGVSV